jgi:hypothetical protein
MGKIKLEPENQTELDRENTSSTGEASIGWI